MKRRQLNNGLASDQNNKTNLKTQQYRCSLINLEESCQDDELDAILGELSVLESQFEEEISQKSTNPGLENLDQYSSKNLHRFGLFVCLSGGPASAPLQIQI